MSEQIPQVGDRIRICFTGHDFVGREGMIVGVDEHHEVVDVQLNDATFTKVNCDDYEYLGPSPQLLAAQQVYASNKAEIDAAIIAKAELALTRLPKVTTFMEFVRKPTNVYNRDRDFLYTHVFDDGVFDPWFDCADQRYAEAVNEMGNMEDDVRWISETWQQVLKEAHPTKYDGIIAVFKDIDDNGL